MITTLLITRIALTIAAFYVLVVFCHVVWTSNVDMFGALAGLMRERLPIAVETGWQPPPIPKNTEDVYVIFGGQEIRFPIATLEESNGIEREKIIRKFWGNSARLPFDLFLRNNRVFLKISYPSIDKLVSLSMDTSLDGMMNSVWARNYNTIEYELTNGADTPFFQVRYDRANKITINGIFGHENQSLRIIFPSIPDAIVMSLDRHVDDLKKQTWFKYPSEGFPGERR